MNSDTSFGLTIKEICGILVLAGAFATALVGFSIKVYAKFQAERDTTVSAISKEEDARIAGINSAKLEVTGLFNTFKSEVTVRLDKVESDLGKKFDTVTATLESIKTLVGSLSERVGVKYVEREEINKANQRFDDRLGLVEQGYVKLAAQNDQVLSMLSDIRSDMGGPRRLPPKPRN